MNKDTRNAIERATQRARKLIEEDFAAQLEGDYDVRRDGAIAAKPGSHLSARQAFQRERVVAAIDHKRGAGMSPVDAARDYLRDAAFTTLNRFVALKMLEARDLVQECVTKGELSAGYREFCGMAPGLPLLPDSAGYRLYLEVLFDELSTEVKVLFDRRDPSSVLWPKRATFEQLLEILNATELTGVWGEDETIGWVYQFFNGQDERKKMRDESQAPRNSRELAVRNQFFTPRYVVQFLTDNTLGRIWWEMRGTNTVLAEKCEYMVRKPGEEFVPRAKKDPRDLRVLDPACGSGHFLLYAFDLLLAIYEEAYGDAESPKSEATGKAIAEDYPSVEALRTAAPGLVLAYNLHGVDIDSRCAQIAQLALWMRAQKAYRDFGIGRGERAQIRRSNIVVAEPLVADEQIVTEFVTKLGDAELGRVFTSLVESLNLAGDMGLLLRVEKLVKATRKQGELFAPPEERIRAALDRFVHEEARATNTRRRLFADDAAQGIGLLAVGEKKFDVVVMNPPFGSGSTKATKEFEKAYPKTKNDVYAAFVERGVELLDARGRVGAITSRTGFFLSSFQRWRELLLETAPPVALADLGLGVMDAAMVESAAYCLQKSEVGAGGSQTVFVRCLEELNDKRGALHTALGDLASGKQSGATFFADPASFAVVPTSPFAYWVSDSLRSTFQRLPVLESDGRKARIGLSTSDDFRFVRLWWEVAHVRAQQSDDTILFAKGGRFSPFYADVYLALRWRDDGREAKAWVVANPSDPRTLHWSRRIANSEFYFRPAITWSLRTKSNISFRAMPAGCLFGHKGPALFIDGDDPDDLLAVAAVVNSTAFRALVEFQLAAGEPAGRGGAARSYEVGVIQRTPLPSMGGMRARAANLARRALVLRRSQDSDVETSHAFVAPFCVPCGVRSTPGDTQRGLEEIQRLIDALAFDLYNIEPQDRAAIEASSSHVSPIAGPTCDEGDDDTTEEQELPGTTTDALVSWLAGVSFGRFDVRIATGERAIPPAPEPFDPLPARSPGMCPEGEETADGPDILVDDMGHPDDLATRAIALAERVKVDVPENLRGWLAKEFFPLHIRMYSKSRRKAPIYWQLATPSASYSIWLYIHTFSKDTLFRVQNDYAVPKLAHEERRLESLTSELRDGATAAQRKELAAQEALVDELRAFLDEVKRVAPLWKPNLDDGVVINFAPLWRLVPQNKAWQKELKSTWDTLCDGKYDWAHLAMHLWPERVVPKCAKDRSLAIAHGLEEVFWVEGSDGKWTARKTPTHSIDDLVQDRTSAAVKSALKSLLEAPAASGAAKKTRKGKTHA